MAPKKSLGQNFLTSPAIAEQIVLASGITKKDTVLEIGPGKGILTHILSKHAREVIAVEKDRELAKQKFGDNVKIIEADILETEIDSLSLPENYHIVANIPYYITGEIIRLFLTTKHQPKSMTILVQKEVADRIVAKDGKQSVLSLSVKAYGEPKFIRTVKAGVFFPKPKVDSAILHIKNISREFFKDKDENLFFSIVKTGFNQKRKKISSSLNSKIKIEDFEKCKIDPSTRPENIDLKDWGCLSKK